MEGSVCLGKAGLVRNNLVAYAFHLNQTSTLKGGNDIL